MRNLYPIFLSLLFIPISDALSQDLKVDGQVFVEGDALLHVDGDAFIDAGGEIQNNGTIEITGDWQNDRPDGDLTYNGTSGQRLIRFIGTSLQTLSSSSGQLLFQNVESTNNSATFDPTTAGIDAIYTSGGVFIEPGVDMIAESVDLDGGDLIFLDQFLTITAGGGISNYNKNNVLHFRGNENSGGGIRWMYSPSDSVYQFPLNHDGVGYLHATVYFDKAPGFSVPSNVGYIEGRFAIKPPVGLGYVNRQWSCAEPVIIGPPGLSHISIDKMLDESDFGYWEIIPYSNDPSPVYIGQEDNDWQYDIRLRVPEEIVEDFVVNQGADYMKIIKIPTHDESDDYIDFRPGDLFGSGNLWTNGIPNSSGRNYCDGMVQIVDYPSQTFPGYYDESIGLKAHDLSSFSRFGLGGNGSGAGLPIELIYLKAKGVDVAYILVEWATAVEINNEKFEVLKSEDGINFTQIGIVAGKGTTSEEQYYSFPDTDVIPNKDYYYMLNQVDYDGTSELTYVVSAKITSTVAGGVFTISEFIPNPSSGNTRLEVTTSEDKELNITLYNTLGQVISIDKHQVNAGVSNELVFNNLNKLAAGTYYAIIRVNTELFTRKLVLTRE